MAAGLTSASKLSLEKLLKALTDAVGLAYPLPPKATKVMLVDHIYATIGSIKTKFEDTTRKIKNKKKE